MLLLARTLGRTVQELQDGMSAEEFGEWQAAYAISPWGEWRQDFNAGIVASTIANVNRNADKRPEPFRPTDPAFMPLQQSEEQDEDASAEQSPVEFFRKLKDGH